MGTVVDLRTVPEDAVMSLYNWVTVDPDTREAAEFRLGGPSAPGDMGSSLDLVSAVVGDLTSIGSLVVACLAWRDSRKTAVQSLRIRRGDTEVELADATPKDCERIVRILTREK